MRHNERGAVLGIVLLSSLVFSIASLAMLSMATSHTQASRHEADKLRARYAAEAGLVRAMEKLWNDPTYCGEAWSIDTNGDGTAETTINITVTNCGAGSNQTISARVSY